MSASFLPAVSAAAPSADPAPIGPASSRPRGPSAPGADDGQDFGTHLHDARQQQGDSDDDSQDASAPAKSPAPPATSANGAKSADGKPDHHHHKAGADSGGDQNDAGTSLAATVLGLIGQAAQPAAAQADAGEEGADPLAATGLSGSALTAAAMPMANALAAGQPTIKPATLPGTNLGAAAVGQAGANGKPASGIVDLDAKLADKDTDGADTDADKAQNQSAQANAGAGTDAGSTGALAANAAAGAAATADGARDAVSAPAAKTHALDPASASAGALAAAPPPSAPGVPHVLDIGAPAGTPGFAQELGEQIAWLGGQDVKQANIRLHPAELGQLDVKVSLSHGRVDVSFSAQHPAAVTAVQQTLGQLDTMLAGHGLSLGQAQVGQQGGDGAPRGQSSGSGDQGGDGETTLLGTTPIRQQRPVGLLDAFA